MGSAAVVYWQRAVLTPAALTLCLALAGCSGGETSPRATTPSATAASTTPTAPPTAEELAEEAATTAFTELLRVTDAARQAPGVKDWEPEIRQYAGDPAAYLAVQSVRDYATLGLRQVGDSQVDVEVTSVDLGAPQGPTVAITGCYDSESAQVVKVDTGETVPPGTPPRYVWNISVVQYTAEPGEPWLVRTLDAQADQPC
jgi:hypothetical protein